VCVDATGWVAATTRGLQRAFKCPAELRQAPGCAAARRAELPHEIASLRHREERVSAISAARRGRISAVNGEPNRADAPPSH
jgi:hypothetical protein